MATARTICTRALRRLGVIDALATPSAQDMAVALDTLNEMRSAWRVSGVDCLPVTLGLDDEAVMFVPPTGLASGVIELVDYKGTWNASTNVPALATASGTAGYAYRVSAAGSSVLDEINTWAVNDYAVFSGVAWLKSKSYDRHDAAVIALLALRLTQEFPVTVPPQLALDAANGWVSLSADYIKPPTASFDSGLRQTLHTGVAGLG